MNEHIILQNGTPISSMLVYFVEVIMFIHNIFSTFKFGALSILGKLSIKVIQFSLILGMVILYEYKIIEFRIIADTISFLYNFVFDTL